MIDNSTYFPIGITVPIVNGTGGYFQQSFDTNTNVKQKLLNFLKTRRGERRMNPEFGSNLHTLVFNQDDDNIREIVKNIITDELLTWIPEISILDITINNGENIEESDNYTLRISIKFIILQTKSSDSITIDLSKISI